MTTLTKSKTPTKTISEPETTPKKQIATPTKRTPKSSVKKFRKFQIQTSNQTSNYFSFDIKNFYDDMYNIILDYGSDSLDDIEIILKQKYSKPEEHEIIVESLNKAQEKFSSVLNFTMDGFEAYCTKNVFQLPPEFQKIQKNEKTTTEEKELFDELTQLRREINEVRSLFFKKKEYKSIQIIQSKNETLRKELNFFEANRTNFEMLDTICKEKNGKKSLNLTT
jgi:hypothetical protein